MKQIFRNLSSGKTIIEDIPVPVVRDGHLLIRFAASLVSAGTERMPVEFGRASLLSKVRQQPDKAKIGTDGLKDTLEAMQSKLDHPLALALLARSAGCWRRRSRFSWRCPDPTADSMPPPGLINATC